MNTFWKYQSKGNLGMSSVSDKLPILAEEKNEAPPPYTWYSPSIQGQSLSEKVNFYLNLIHVHSLKHEWWFWLAKGDHQSNCGESVHSEMVHPRNLFPSRLPSGDKGFIYIAQDCFCCKLNCITNKLCGGFLVNTFKASNQRQSKQTKTNLNNLKN